MKQVDFQSIIRVFCNEVGYADEKFLFSKLGAKFMPPFVTENNAEQLDNYYRKTVIPHKVEVYRAGFELRRFMQNEKFCSTRFAEHDLSKLSANESAYAYHNFKDKSQNTKEQTMSFELAWHHHKQNNSHHPEHWFSVDRAGNTVALPMPNDDVVEMVADWIGAGKTYGNTLEGWLPSNIGKFRLHPLSAKKLYEILTEITDFKFEVFAQNKDAENEYHTLVIN